MMLWDETRRSHDSRSNVLFLTKSDGKSFVFNHQYEAGLCLSNSLETNICNKQTQEENRTKTNAQKRIGWYSPELQLQPPCQSTFSSRTCHGWRPPLLWGSGLSTVILHTLIQVSIMHNTNTVEVEEKLVLNLCFSDFMATGIWLSNPNHNTSCFVVILPKRSYKNGDMNEWFHPKVHNHKCPCSFSSALVCDGLWCPINSLYTTKKILNIGFGWFLQVETHERNHEV